MKSKKDLFFDKVSYQESAINAPDGVPVSTAFVYHETTRELLYVMEKNRHDMAFYNLEQY